MIGGLVQLGVTVMMTAEITESYTELRLSGHGISFLTDGLILQRYVEHGGALCRVMSVVKMRGCPHSSAFHFYEISEQGLVIGEALANYEGVLSGTLRPTSPRGIQET
jgi:circadian clock protein KaiC